MSRNPSLTKGHRLGEIFRRLAAATAVTTASAAYQLLCDTINAVEDELTDIPFNPPQPPEDDGRIYPPQPDSARTVPGHPGMIRYVSRGHDTLIGENGAIRIVNRKSRVAEFDKSGADGRDVM